MNNTLVDKIKLVFEMFYQNNSPKVWSVGTNLIESWEKFLTKINFTSCEIKIEKKDKKSYVFILNGENITPSKKRQWGDSAIKQFLKFGDFFGFVDYDMYEKNPNSFYLLKNKILIKNENDWAKLIIEKIKDNFKYNKDKKYLNHLSFSFFLCLICDYCKDIFSILLKSNYFITIEKLKHNFWKKKTNNNDENISIIIDFIVGDNKGFNGLNYSYKRALDIFKKCKISLDEFVCSLLNEKNIIDSNDELLTFIDKKKFTSESQIKQIEFIEKKIKTINNTLRKNIWKERVCNNELYSDLIYEDGRPFLLIQPDFLEACHIYTVSDIINKIKLYANNKIQEDPSFFYDSLSTKNNGIALTRNLHWAFDNNKIWFNSNGYLCSTEEYKKSLPELIIKGEDKVRINPKVFNEEMKKYFKKRN